MDQVLLADAPVPALPAESADERSGDTAARRTPLARLGDAAFAVAFTAYAGWGVLILALGLAAVVAHALPGWHDSLHEEAFSSAPWARAAQRIADASHEVDNTPALLVDFTFSLVNVVLAVFLLWLRRGRRDWAARLLAVAMIGTAAIFNLTAHTVYEVVEPSALDEFGHDAFHVVAGVAYTFALLLFPDSRLVPRWHPARVALLYALVIPALATWAVTTESVSRTAILVTMFGVVTPAAGVAAQAYRMRRSATAVERQQSRLLFWALVPALLVATVALVFGLQGSGDLGLEGRDVLELPTALFRVFQAGFALIPLALFAGLVRYRLWDIDKVISRTLVYSVLAAFVSAVYVAVVVGVGSLIGGRPADDNLGLSIVATGIVAVAFQPVRERVQRFADLLVYGHRATPYEVLSQFSERVAETAATEEVLGRMAKVLAEGTASSSATVWLKVGAELRPAAVWPTEVGHGEAVPLAAGDEIPELAGVTMAVPVRHQGELYGALSVTKPGSEGLNATEEKLLSDLGLQAGLVLRNVRLTAELLERLQELRASRQRLVAAQDLERRRLERNLHDGAQQQLVALKVQLALAENVAEELEGGQTLAQLLNQLKESTGEALENLRDLARGIYPPLLAAEGLPTALASQARKATIPVEVRTHDIGRYPQEIEAAVYFISLEALQNVTKYAEASSVVIDLSEADGQLRFCVSDDGKGFDPALAAFGSGCRNMADRVEALDGYLEIRSAPGSGTSVVGSLPIPV